MISDGDITPQKERNNMIILLALALLIGGYLVYALVHPERF